MMSRMRCSGRSNAVPSRPSTTCGPDAPSPSTNRPPDSAERESAVRAAIVAVGEEICKIPDPRVILVVTAARYPSAETASAPHASATQQQSTPSRSDSRTNVDTSSQPAPGFDIWMAVRNVMTDTQGTRPTPQRLPPGHTSGHASAPFPVRDALRGCTPRP